MLLLTWNYQSAIIYANEYKWWNISLHFYKYKDVVRLGFIAKCIFWRLLKSFDIKSFYIHTWMPLNLSERRLSNSTIISINTEIIIRQVATAKIVGLNCSLSPVHIWIGMVVWPGPAKNNITTTSSKEVTKAKSAPEITPGKIRGRVILKKVFTGVLPKLDAALVMLWSNPVKVAVTVITTKGVPSAACARIRPRWV